jgi:hypothetical protein
MEADVDAPLTLAVLLEAGQGQLPEPEMLATPDGVERAHVSAVPRAAPWTTERVAA